VTLRSTQNGEGLGALRISRPKEKPQRKRSPVVLVVILTFTTGIVSFAAFEMYSRTIGRPVVVQTAIVASNQGSQPGVLLTGSGYMVTRHKYITIGTKILGQIVSEPIEEGQHVKVGDIVAQIDDRDYQAQLRQAIASRDLSEANVKLNLAKADRARKLIGGGAISRDEYDTAINRSEVAQAELERDQAAVDYAKFEVGQCLITSPINGIVLHKYRELGDTINFGGQIQAGGGATDIAQLADTDDMRAEVDINEADISKVSIGSPASVVPDAYADRTFDALLIKVYPAADRQKGTIKVEVHLTKPDLEIIKPEMSVKVSFLEAAPTGTETQGVTVPKSAIRTEGNESYVWTVHDGIVRRVGISIRRKTETGVEVSLGLKDGDMVVTTPQVNLSDGTKVSIGGE
jgi:RND family efflux transporter MFP subunit